MLEENLGEDYKLCPELKKIMKGAAYSSAKIKVKCEDCKYNSFLFCKKFKPLVNKFTGDKGNRTYKSDLNKEGLCKHFKKKSFLQRFFA